MSEEESKEVRTAVERETMKKVKEKKKEKRTYHVLAGEMVCTKEFTGGNEAYISSPTSGMFTSAFKY